MSASTDNNLSTLTVRLRNEDEREALRYVMREAGIAWASQAVIYACHAFRIHNEREKSELKDFKARMGERIRQQNRKQQQLIDELRRENEMLRKKLERIRSILDDGRS